MAEADTEKYPSLPSNYVSIAQLQERWLKEKQRKQQEKEKEQEKIPEIPLERQNHGRSRNGQVPAQQKRENHSVTSWIAKEPKVKIVTPVVEESVDGQKEKKKKRNGSFKQRKPRVIKDLTGDKAEVESVENGEGGVYSSNNNNVSSKVPQVGSGEGSVYADLTLTTGGVSKGKNERDYKNKDIIEVATVCAVEVVEENKEIPRKRWKKGFKGKRDGKRMMGNKVVEVGNKAESVEQSGQEHNVEEKEKEEEKVSVDVRERISDKLSVRGTFGVKSRDVPSIDSGASLRMKVERNFGNLSLSDKRNGYGDKRRYGNSMRYETRKIWVKKGESLIGNAAEFETQVDSSSQSTNQG